MIAGLLTSLEIFKSKGKRSMISNLDEILKPLIPSMMLVRSTEYGYPDLVFSAAAAVLGRVFPSNKMNMVGEEGSGRARGSASSVQLG